MRAYELPTSLNINGVAYTIRTDFRAIIDILIAMNDPDLDQQAKTFIMLQILYEEWQNIPFEDLTEACQKACDFIDCGQVDKSYECAGAASVVESLQKGKCQKEITGP